MTTHPHKKIKTIKALYAVCIILLSVTILYVLQRVFLFDQFSVNSTSMAPTIVPGNKVVVNKMIFGARIYKNWDFGESKQLSAFRVAGFRSIRHNDIVVFNGPQSNDSEKIRFKINYVYVKRCLGLPDDSLSVINGFYKNNHFADTLGHFGNQFMLSNYVEKKTLSEGHSTYPRQADSLGWDIKDFGPLYIPRSGKIITLDTKNYYLYKSVIEYETGQSLRLHNNNIFLDNEPINDYAFQKDYYFMAGDNVENSKDSRYFGLVPEEFIVGVVCKIRRN